MFRSDMAWRFRKSIRVLPGLRLNLSRRGVGYSFGTRGLRVSRGADGTYRRTVSMPGTGIYRTDTIQTNRKQRRAVASDQQPEHVSSEQAATGSAVATSGELRSRPGLRWMKNHPKTSVAGAVLLLAVLASTGGGGGEDDESTDVVTASGVTADDAAEEAAARQIAEAEAAREAAEAEASRLAAELEAERAAAAEAAAAEAAAAQAAAAEAARLEAERAAAEQAAAAEAATRAEAERRAAEQAAAAAQSSSSSVADPRFRTCKEAIANGYGPYRQGADEEYAWYRDADNDGVNCES
jgi:flagellar biosynthesis GTPase FlhF